MMSKIAASLQKCWWCEEIRVFYYFSLNIHCGDFSYSLSADDSNIYSRPGILWVLILLISQSPEVKKLLNSRFYIQDVFHFYLIDQAYCLQCKLSVIFITADKLKPLLVRICFYLFLVALGSIAVPRLLIALSSLVEYRLRAHGLQ